MMPMIDPMMIPGATTALIYVGPVAIGVGLALVAGLAWAVRETAKELRRTPASDRKVRAVHVEMTGRPALAA